MSRDLLTLTLLLAVMLVSACTTEQVYTTGQSWQRNQCASMLDKFEYDRCVAGTNTAYDSYKRQTEPQSK